MIESDQLALLYLRIALRQPGCPICRVGNEAATRYLRYLLRESVNDLTTRVRISESQGFCPQHACELLDMEVTRLRRPLGNSIIYEDLVGQVAGTLRRVQASPPHPVRPVWWQRWWSALRRRSADSAHDGPQSSLAPRGDCPACVSYHHSCRFTATNLVRMLATPEYQAMYAQSDGVCLSHLRLALHLADSDAGRLHLVASTEERLATLEDDLREYTRKQVWQNRHETVTVEEQTAAQRSVDFFAGSAFGERCNHRPIARPFVQQGDGSPELVPDDLAVWESSPLQAGKDDTPGRDNRRPGR